MKIDKLISLMENENSNNSSNNTRVDISNGNVTSSTIPCANIPGNNNATTSCENIGSNNASTTINSKYNNKNIHRNVTLPILPGYRLSTIAMNNIQNRLNKLHK